MLSVHHFIQLFHIKKWLEIKRLQATYKPVVIIPTPHVVRLERVFTIAFCPFGGLEQVFLACFRPFFQYILQIGTSLVRQKCTKTRRFRPEIILFYSTISGVKTAF